MSEQLSNEKEREKSSSEKDWWRSDRLDAIWWGITFVWGALVLVAETTNYAANFSWWNGWGVFFTGIGVVALIGTVIRLQMPAYRKKWVGSLIAGLIMLAIGLGNLVDSDWVWILVLIIIGVSILIHVLIRKR